MQTRSGKMFAHELILEVTRNCNLACAHCLRGPKQPKNMSQKVIDAVFNKIGGCHSLCLTGGEPFLVPHVLRKILKKIRESGFCYDNIYIVTNGTQMLRPGMWDIVMSFIAGAQDQEIMPAIDLSNSDYHLDEIRDCMNEEWIKSRKFMESLCRDGEGLFHIRDLIKQEETSKVINMGNALEYGLSSRPVEDIKYVVDGSEIYISANGKVMLGCDFSYDVIDDCHIDHIVSGCLDPELGLDAHLASDDQDSDLTVAHQKTNLEGWLERYNDLDN